MYNMLIVEDERIERESIGRMLQQHFSGEIGSLRYATNGEEALQEFSRDEPDLVFLDIHIPKINGLELLEKLNRQLKTEIIIISAYSQFEYARQALRLGVRDYLLKPVDTDQFTRVVQEALDSLRRKEEASKIIQELTGSQNHELHTEFTGEFASYLENEVFMRFSELSFSEDPTDAVKYLLNHQKEFTFENLLHFLVVFFQSLDLPQNEFLTGFKLSEEDQNNLYQGSSPALLEHVVSDFMKNIHVLIQQDAGTEQTKKLVHLVDDYLQEHYSQQLSLEKLGTFVNRNPAYISRLYKEETGVNIKDRLRSIRINSARILLEQGNTSVKEVAYSVGFSDPNYFSTVFKKETGLSATDYVLFYDKKFEEK